MSRSTYKLYIILTQYCTYYYTNTVHCRLVYYELLYESPSNRKDRLRLIISSQYLYFFRDSPPDPKTLDSRIPLDQLEESRPVKGKTSESCYHSNGHRFHGYGHCYRDNLPPQVSPQCILCCVFLIKNHR